ncbi:polycomb group RING finger protein 1 [Heterodontus francisci]|uniref:polycomb group RING finger protein 1 n=1 Tax=Heterodontus francisci TaxID=7792 RepID=UPI00355AFE41
MAVDAPMANAMRLRNQLQTVYKLDPLRNEVCIQNVQTKLNYQTQAVYKKAKEKILHFCSAFPNLKTFQRFTASESANITSFCCTPSPKQRRSNDCQVTVSQFLNSLSLLCIDLYLEELTLWGTRSSLERHLVLYSALHPCYSPLQKDLKKLHDTTDKMNAPCHMMTSTWGLPNVCKSCIVKYLQTSKYCPMCNIKIHETQPLLNLKLDRVMQDIVYKLVPGLQESEEKRIREFYQSRGLDRIIQPVNEAMTPDLASSPYTTFDYSKAHYYRYDEQVSLCLERHGSSLGKEKGKMVLQQKYVRCSVRAEIRHLRRVLCHRINVLDQQQVQILFDNEPLPEHMTMKQLWLLRWYGKPTPMVLQYSVKEKRGR